MSITFLTGPMFGGKSTELIRLVDRYTRARKYVLSIKPVIDDRSGRDDLIKSHNDQTTTALSVAALADVPQDRVEMADVIAIDEGQFFDDLHAFCKQWADGGKKVIVAALKGNAKRQPWPSVSLLLPEVDFFTMCPAVCYICGSEDGTFTTYMPGFCPDSIIAVGGADEYRSVCRVCLNDVEKQSIKA